MELVSNKNYVLLFLSFMFIYGIQASLAATYATLAAKYAYPLSANSTACLLFMVGGIFNSFFLSTILDRYQNYKKLIVIVCFLSILTCLLHFVSLPSKNIIFEGSSMLMLGLSVVPISSIAYTFAVELTFPVPEALTNGLMITFSLVWGTAAGFACSAMADLNPLYPLIFWAGSAIIAICFSFFIEQDLRRL